MEGKDRGTIFWDFDGTLIHSRPMWAQAVIDVVKLHDPKRDGLTIESVRPHIQRGFPWHTPETPRLELRDPGAWWAHMDENFKRVFEDFGFSAEVAKDLAGKIRPNIIRPEVYQPYDDALEVLNGLKDRGWKQVILSNHVPELSEIIAQIGLAGFFEETLVSAKLGYEKPHPEIFALAKRSAKGGPMWMVGDNLVADIQGAEKAGIPAILVHQPSKRHLRQAGTLKEVAAIIETCP